LRSVRKVSQEGNEQAARIILADSERYAGLPLIWARLWVEKAQGLIPQTPCRKDPRAMKQAGARLS
jgi:hypothetical protein